MEKILADEIIEKMKNGWSLWSFLGIRAERMTYILQKGERGHGGDSKTIHGATINSLEKKGIIIRKSDNHYNSNSHYILPPPKNK